MTARVLVVCTANICRSPMVQAVLTHRLAALGADVRVRSAGLAADPSRAIDRDVVDVLGARGIPVAPHTPRRATRDLLLDDGADLVITMTRRQLRELVVLERTAFSRTFTLRELARRLAALPVAGSLADGVAAAAAGRSASLLMGDDPVDDLADPHGQGRRAIESAATDVVAMVDVLAHRLAWPAPASTGC